jgi:protein required for attachment to host cells
MTITWAILADRAQARILEIRGPGRVSVVEHIDHPDGRWQDHAAGTDRPGRSFDSHGDARHALEPEESPSEHLAMRFARELGARLRTARLGHRFDRLVLAAEPRFLGRLRAALDGDTRRLVAAEVPKHLVHAADRDVELQLASVV